MFHVPEKCRIKTGQSGSHEGYGNNGAFMIGRLLIIASDGEGWEHVSISLPDRQPRWNEMCKIKNIFWDEEDCAIQYHPPKSEYVNCHPNCLHLWRPIGISLPIPPSLLVGPK